MRQYIYIEMDLIEESSEILNEQIVLKFVKKDQVPDDFKKEALRICETLEKESNKKGAEGIMAASMWEAFGIRINNAHKKIENSNIKNLYTLSFSHKAITKATGTERKFLDNLIMNPKLIFDYMRSTLTKLGYKKVSEKPGAYESFYKKKKNCMYAVDTQVAYGVVTIFIRCLEDTEENRTMLAGGKLYSEEKKK